MDDIARFRKLVKEIKITEDVSWTYFWDMRVKLPPKGAAYRAETMGFLYEKIYAMKTAPELKELCDRISNKKDNDKITSGMVKRVLKEYKKLMDIPAKLYSDFAEHNMQTAVLWQEARKKSDYAMLKNNLERQFDFKRKFAESCGYVDNPLDWLVGHEDEGMTTAKLDKIFDELKTGVMHLLGKINASGIKYNKELIYGNYPIGKQREFCRKIVADAGFDFEAGRLDESAHPFSLAWHDKTDIRMTTRYFEHNFTGAASSSMHEMGHSVYAQNHSDEIRGTTLDYAPSLGWHESQSKFYENMVGRSKPFWSYYLPIAKTYFDSLKDMTLDNFYNSLNAVNISPLRLNSDELTYNLHIIIRYEIEKMIFARQVKFDELPELWNKKINEYLGVTPQNDAEGILQDIHWSNGNIGMFQSYALGNCYGGHFFTKITKEIPDMYDQIGKGKFDDIFNWLKDNIHVHGRIYNSVELLDRLTGEELSPKHYLDYLNQKYTELYKL